MSGPSVKQQLRALISEGANAEDAVRKVLRICGKRPLAEYAWPFLLREAQNMERDRVRAVENAAFSGSGKRRKDALRKLPRTKFKTRDFTGKWGRIEWSEATREHHEARRLWYSLQIDSLRPDLRRHERALKLLADHGAERLGDIPGWEELMEDPPDGGASGPVAA